MGIVGIGIVGHDHWLISRVNARGSLSSERGGKGMVIWALNTRRWQR